MLVWIVDHPMLKREILFKPVLDWLRDDLGDAEVVVSASPPDRPADMLLSAPEIDAGGTALPVTTAAELVRAREALRRLTNLRFLEAGVDVVDIDTAFIHPDTDIGEGTTIYPHVVIRAGVTIGKHCSIGPFAYLRPGTVIGDDVKIGDFVEIKNSAVGDKTSVSHLTYIGDADVGRGVNFGCGTVTVNYDGKKKFRTVVGDGAFVGCNTNLIAPVTVGENAYTAAGSTITTDVPDGALGIARARQTNKESWLSPKKKAALEEPNGR